MSLEVNIVTSDTVKKNKVKSLTCPFPDLFKTAFASHLKKPVSSKNIDNTVIDKNRASSFAGSSKRHLHQGMSQKVARCQVVLHSVFLHVKLGSALFSVQVSVDASLDAVFFAKLGKGAVVN